MASESVRLALYHRAMWQASIAPAPALALPAWIGSRRQRRTWVIHDSTQPVPEGLPRYVGEKG